MPPVVVAFKPPSRGIGGQNLRRQFIANLRREPLPGKMDPLISINVPEVILLFQLEDEIQLIGILSEPGFEGFLRPVFDQQLLEVRPEGTAWRVEPRSG